MTTLKIAHTREGVVFRRIWPSGEDAYRLGHDGSWVHSLDHKGPWLVVTTAEVPAQVLEAAIAMPQTFPNITAALAYWQDRDHAPLKGAVAPPCDVLGDEIYDAMLACFFRQVATLPTATEQIVHIANCISVHAGPLKPLKTIEHEPLAQENIARLERMLFVLLRWAGQIAASGRPQMGEAA